VSSPNELTLEADDYRLIPLRSLHPDPDNIREILRGEPIDSLADSILSQGQLQPITVYPIGGTSGFPLGDGDYRVWMGHRRHAAFEVLRERGYQDLHVGCIIVDPPLDNLSRLDKMTAENLKREQLNPVEEARLYQRYIDEGLNQLQITKRLNVSKTRVSTYLTLLTASFSMQRSVAAGQTTVTAALAQLKHYRGEAGRAHGNLGVKRMNSSTPHFNPHHRLHDTAMELCRSKPGHEMHVKLGGACGSCWEYVILADSKVHAPVDIRYNEPDPDVPVEEARPTAGGLETFYDPRVMMRRVKCIRCGCPANEYQQRQCAGVREGPDHVKRRSLFDHHEFRMAVSASHVKEQ
jgi:ParB/RepB/Spo0J family partition protein